MHASYVVVGVFRNLQIEELSPRYWLPFTATGHYFFSCKFTSFILKPLYSFSGFSLQYFWWEMSRTCKLHALITPQITCSSCSGRIYRDLCHTCGSRASVEPFVSQNLILQSPSPTGNNKISDGSSPCEQSQWVHWRSSSRPLHS